LNFCGLNHRHVGGLFALASPKAEDTAFQALFSTW
jgi:hypothetical protein